MQLTENGGDGNDVLVGSPGNDILNGGAGLDYLIGDGGTDILDWGTGETFTVSPFASEAIALLNDSLASGFHPSTTFTVAPTLSQETSLAPHV